ncbi:MULTISPECIES: hypothetical protein [Nonomuraea]|uniref:Uncharacterized protein n=1 Tax=Nonomuraea mangrovi TaxID=2316207 RepID=A0ABW4SP04_9ACTN
MRDVLVGNLLLAVAVVVSWPREATGIFAWLAVPVGELLEMSTLRVCQVVQAPLTPAAVARARQRTFHPSLSLPVGMVIMAAEPRPTALVVLPDQIRPLPWLVAAGSCSTSTVIVDERPSGSLSVR